MTVRTTKPAVNLREKLTDLTNPPRYQQKQFFFVGDGSTAEFTLERGWKPFSVFNAGLIKKEGSGDDYTVGFDGFIYTVSFAVAPTLNNDIIVIGERT